MTKKDFELIANCINESYKHHTYYASLVDVMGIDEDARDTLKEVEHNFVKQLKANNPHFNEDKFRDACNRGIPQ